MNATRDTTRKKGGWCRKETLEKERWFARGGGGGRSKRAVFFTSPPSRPLVGRWVVERGLPRLLSVSRTSGLYRVLFSSFLSYSLSLVLIVSLSPAPFLFGPSLSLSLSHFCPIPRSTLATLLFRDLVSAAAFLFFAPSDLYARLPPPLPPSLPPRCQPRPCFAALYTRALFRLLLRSVPTACVSTAKSIDRNVFRSGRNERECNRREWGGI